MRYGFQVSNVWARKHLTSMLFEGLGGDGKLMKKLKYKTTDDILGHSCSEIMLLS